MKLSHHQSFRKRGARGLEPFPARSAWLRLLDRTVLFVGIVGPLMTIPQIYKIFAFQDAGGVSVMSWATFAVFDIPWILYGLAHRDRPILITYTLWLIMNSIVVVGALMYGNGFL